MKSAFVEQLLETAPVAVYLYDLGARRTVLMSGGSFHKLGHAPADLQASDTLVSLLHPDDKARFERQIQRLAAAGDGEPLVFEYRLRAKGGGWRWFRSRDVVFARGRDGQVTQIVGVATDITAERRVEEERNRLVSVIEAAEDLVGMCRPDGSLLYVNPAGRQLLGMDVDERLTGLHLEDFHPRDEVARMFEKVFPAAARGGPVRTDTILRRRDGHTIPVSLVLCAHRGRDGRVAYYSAVMRDLSGERRATAELERLNAALAAEAARRSSDAERARRQRAETSRELGRRLRDPVAALRRCMEALTARGGHAVGLDQLDGAVRRLEQLAEALGPVADERGGAPGRRGR